MYNLSKLDSIIKKLEETDDLFELDDLKSFIQYDYRNYPYLGKSNKELFELYNNCQSANIKETIIISNIKLINWCIRNILSDIDMSLDLQLLGLEGLVKAVNTYKKNKYSTFTKYAITYILLYIKSGFKDVVNISFDDYMVDNKMNNSISEIEDISDIEDIYERVKELNSLYTYESLDSEEYIHFIEEIPDTDYDIDLDLDIRMLSRELYTKLSVLTQRQRTSLLYEYGFYPEITSRETIAKMFGVTRETIRTDAKVALKILKANEKVPELNINKTVSFDDKIYRRIYELYKNNVDYDTIHDILVNEYIVCVDAQTVKRKMTKTIHHFVTILNMCKNSAYSKLDIILVVYDRWKENLSMDFISTLIEENRKYNDKKINLE